jgi:hypothetical protein
MFKNIENISMNKSERILVEDMDYFTRALKVYKNVTTYQPRVLKNLLIWTLVKDKTGLLPKRYKDARLDFDKVIKLTQYPGRFFNFPFIVPSLNFILRNLFLKFIKYDNGRSKDGL